MNFGEALELIKRGFKVAREGWNGKNMYLMYALNGDFTSVSRNPSETGRRILLQPFIVMRTANNKFVPWLASQTDMLADDWVVVV